jgi:hypothetical protein
MKDETTKPSDNPENADPHQPPTADLLKDWTPEIAGVKAVDDPEDPDTDRAVADIVAHESDEILAIEDMVTEAENEPDEEPSRWARIRHWLGSKQGRWTIGVTIAAMLVVSILTPAIRYFVLNTAGVRVKSSATVIDLTTQQPLKNTVVKVGSAEGTTDAEGNVTLSGVRLGKQRLVIDKLAFSSVDKSVTVGLGSNPLGTFELTPTGVRYEFHVSKFLSGEKLGKVELASGAADARTNDEGVAVLTVDQPADTFVVRLSGSGLRTDDVKIDAATKKPITVSLVSERKHAYASKRSGKLDLYSNYADSKGDKLILAGTGSERETDMTIAPHPTKNTVAYVSTRSGRTNDDGYLLSSLLLVDTNSGENTHIVTTERINVIGWQSDRLIYLQITQGPSATKDERYKLMSYDPETNNSQQLASANYMNDAQIFAGQVYFAPSGALQPEKAKLYRVNVDGSNQQVVIDQEIWRIIRTDIDAIVLSVSDQTWYEYRSGQAKPTSRPGAPTDMQSRRYTTSPNGGLSAWVDERDGKGTLLIYNHSTKTEKSIAATAGLNYPLQWIDDDALIYRLSDDNGTADYVVSIKSGQTQKLSDVTAASQTTQ